MATTSPLQFGSFGYDEHVSPISPARTDSGSEEVSPGRSSCRGGLSGMINVQCVDKRR